jgi:hypothetical protein
MKSRDGFAGAIVIFIVLALVVIGGIAYVYYVYLPHMASENTSAISAVATSTVSETAPENTPTSISITELKAGDKVGTFTVVSSSYQSGAAVANGFSVQYSGSSTISGTGNFIGRLYGEFCFIPDSSSVNKIPRVEEDQQSPVFCFRPNLPASVEQTISSASNGISIIIDNYQENYSPSEGTENYAQFVGFAPGSAPQSLTDSSNGAPMIRITSPTASSVWSLSSGGPYAVTWQWQGLDPNTPAHIFIYLPSGLQCELGTQPMSAGKMIFSFSDVNTTTCVLTPRVVPGQYRFAVNTPAPSGGMLATAGGDWFNVTQ